MTSLYADKDRISESLAVVSGGKYSNWGRAECIVSPEYVPDVISFFWSLVLSYYSESI